MITAKELRELLADIPDDTPIILQRDDEGNGYRYMNGLDFTAEGSQRNLFDGEECVKEEDFDGEYNAAYTLVAVAF